MTGSFRCYCACGCIARIPIEPGKLIQTDKHMQPLCMSCTFSAGPDCTLRPGFIRRLVEGFKAWCRP